MNSKPLHRGFSRAFQWILKGNNRAKLFFLFLSIFLWTLIKLSQGGYVGTVSFPVEYSNVPDEKILASEPPSAIDVQMQATGFTLVRYSWYPGRKLQVDLNQLEQLRDGRYYWTSSPNLSTLQQQIVDDARFLSIQPDTVFFDIQPRLTKMVPVQANVVFSSNSSYSLYQRPQIIPDSVELTGTPGALESIDSLETKELNIGGGVEDSIVRNIALELPQKEHLNFSHTQVRVKVQLTRLTEETVEVPIEQRNVPDTLRLELYPATAKLTYRVALRDFNRLRPEEFTLFVDYQEVAANPGQRFLKVQSEEPPERIRKMSWEPKRLEYIATKK